MKLNFDKKNNKNSDRQKNKNNKKLLFVIVAIIIVVIIIFLSYFIGNDHLDSNYKTRVTVDTPLIYLKKPHLLIGGINRNFCNDL